MHGVVGLRGFNECMANPQGVMPTIQLYSLMRPPIAALQYEAKVGQSIGINKSLLDCAC